MMDFFMMRPLGAPDMAFMMGGAPMPLFPPIFRPVHVPVNQINTERIRIEVEISEIKKADEESAARGDRFSRQCRSCRVKEPRTRFVAVKCGHAVCEDCFENREEVYVGSGACRDKQCREWIHPTVVWLCPNCKVRTTFTRLYEAENGSRECAICLTPAPYVRDLFSRCGHIVCRSCSLNLELENNGAHTTCPFCRENGPTKELIEELVQDEIRCDVEEEEHEEVNVEEPPMNLSHRQTKRLLHQSRSNRQNQFHNHQNKHQNSHNKRRNRVNQPQKQFSRR